MNEWNQRKSRHVRNAEPEEKEAQRENQQELSRHNHQDSLEEIALRMGKKNNHAGAGKAGNIGRSADPTRFRFLQREHAQTSCGTRKPLKSIPKPLPDTSKTPLSPRRPPASPLRRRRSRPQVRAAALPVLYPGSSAIPPHLFSCTPLPLSHSALCLLAGRRRRSPIAPSRRGESAPLLPDLRCTPSGSGEGSGQDFRILNS